VLYYRVVAYKGTALSAYSNIVSAMTKGLPGGGGTGGLPGTPGGGGTHALSRPSGGLAPILDPLAGLDPQNQGIFSDQYL
jgi:hypothetical protein